MAKQEAQPLAQSSPQQSTGAQQAAPQSPSPQQPAPPAKAGPVIILDPAHGGTDTGARGESGAVEKNIVLEYARIARLELERQGFRVVMTRSDDSNPSYDDRATTANAYPGAIFISFHVSSTGTLGTARVYYYEFASPLSGPAPSSPSNGLAIWEEAQRPYTEMSHHLADLLQGELAQRFPGSPTAATAFAVRELRSVEAPAMAIEISSVSASDPSSLALMAAPLAMSISRSIEAFHPAGPAGTK